jgi:nicotinamide-nucleotide amidase
MLAEKIAHWEDALPKHIKLAYLPNPMAVRLRLSAMGTKEELLKEEVEQEIQKLLQIIPESIFGYNNETLSEVTGRILAKNGKTLAVAESCTGGYISHLVTAVAGSSGYYQGSVTSYSNQTKETILNVNHNDIEKYGAVSKEVAEQMVEGVKKALDADYAISTTGIAGPGGGSPEKPVGTVWIAVSGPKSMQSKKYVFVGDDRDRNILRASQTALQMLRRLVLNDLGE